VLITGETGVGKELVAGMIHRKSRRASRPLVTINCAGLPDSLLESELFGHVRGSFTDAHRHREGIFQAANGGTVFLDEVGEMSLRMQAVMLRFLETGELQRVGADRTETRVDVRVVTATNRSLMGGIEAKLFRADLFYRLNVLHIVVSPLRDRREDIPLLVDHFLKLGTQRHGIGDLVVSEDAMAQLVGRDWPGNVRELMNVVERVVVRCRTGTVTLGDVVSELPGESVPPAREEQPLALALYERMTKDGHSFWDVVYKPFMLRDLTRRELRLIIGYGLEQVRGSYKLLLQLFNMPQEDYKRFLNFLSKHDCHLPFQRFRAVPEDASSRVSPRIKARA
jgi:transcriptional regulator with GAF, ATPase, and Fis domain